MEQISMYNKKLKASPPEPEILEILHHLEQLPVSVEILRNTMVGKSVNKIKRAKHADGTRVYPSCQEVAVTLLKKWKSLTKSASQPLTTPSCKQSFTGVSGGKVTAEKETNKRVSPFAFFSNKPAKTSSTNNRNAQEVTGGSRHKKNSRSFNSQSPFSSNMATLKMMPVSSSKPQSSSSSSYTDSNTRHSRNHSNSHSSSNTACRDTSEARKRRLKLPSDSFLPRKTAKLHSGSSGSRQAEKQHSLAKRYGIVYKDVRRNARGTFSVPSLVDMCAELIGKNLSSIGTFPGKVPSNLVPRMLSSADGHQLERLCNLNPWQLDAEDTDQLWERTCKNELGMTHKHDDETWKAAHERFHKQRKERLAKATAKLRNATRMSMQEKQKKQIKVLDMVPGRKRRVTRRDGIKVSSVYAPKKGRHSSNLMEKLKSDFRKRQTMNAKMGKKLFGNKKRRPMTLSAKSSASIKRKKNVVC